MRSNEERVVEVKRRIEQKKRKDRLQRSRMVMALAVAASLLLIVGLSAYMPEFTGQLSADSYSHYEMTASIFHRIGCFYSWRGYYDSRCSYPSPG